MYMCGPPESKLLPASRHPCHEQLGLLRPKKKLCLFPVTCLKILGSVGRKNLFFLFFIFFFKEVMTKLFSNQFCFFYI